MFHRIALIGLVALVAGCDLVPSDSPASIGGSWGGVAAALTVRHDSTFWYHECLSGVVPVPIQVSQDGSFLAKGTMVGSAFLFAGQPARLYGAVQADTMHLYFQIQDVHGTWAAPSADLLIRGQAATDPGILCVD